MLRLTILTCLTAICAAQEPEAPTATHMEVLSEAVNELQNAIAQGARHEFQRPLAAIRQTIASLRDPSAQHPQRKPASVWLQAIEESATAMSRNDGTAATDEFDMSRLRAACTACHLQNRTDNDVRGIFPNRNNALFGNLKILSKDGKPREDMSGAVVFLEGELKPAGPLPRKPTISQQGRKFLPPVLVVTVGTTVRFPNNDVVFHNVFSRSRSNPFDLGTYGKGKERKVVLNQTGLVRVHCNIHRDMAADVLVLENRYAAVTEADGFWSIPDVPDGEYRLRVWHPLADVKPQVVRCEGSVAKPIAITVRQTKSVVLHTNKHGRKYRSSY